MQIQQLGGQRPTGEVHSPAVAAMHPNKVKIIADDLFISPIANLCAKSGNTSLNPLNRFAIQQFVFSSKSYDSDGKGRDCIETRPNLMQLL